MCLVYLEVDILVDFVCVSYGLYVDEGYKILVVRNRVFFGVFCWNEFDDGDDWSEISLLMSVVFEFSFRIFGVELMSVCLVLVVWLLGLFLVVVFFLWMRYLVWLLSLLFFVVVFEM